MQDINAGLAAYSDYAFLVAFSMYIFAVFLGIWQIALLMGGRVSNVPAEAEAAELVTSGAARERAAGGSAGTARTLTRDSVGGVGPGRGAGGAARGASGAGASGGGKAAEDWDEAEERQYAAAKWGRLAWILTFFGLAGHLAGIVLRGVATHRVPWGNLFEYIMAAAFVCAVAAVVLLWKPRFRVLIPIVLVPIVILMFIGESVYSTAAPVVPALKSYWIVLHVAVIVGGLGVLLFSGAIALLFLIRSAIPPREDYAGMKRLVNVLPGPAALDRLAYRSAIIGFLLLTIGVIFGAIWAEQAWGRYWAWDPKETMSFVTWVIYAAYLHARTTTGWKETTAAWINVFGLAAMLFNVFYINFQVEGLHSYA